MITEIFIGSNHPNDDFENGVDITLVRVNGETYITIKIEDDGGKRLIPEFEIELEDLKKAILKLEI